MDHKFKLVHVLITNAWPIAFHLPLSAWGLPSHLIANHPLVPGHIPVFHTVRGGPTAGALITRSCMTLTHDNKPLNDCACFCMACRAEDLLEIASYWSLQDQSADCPKMATSLMTVANLIANLLTVTSNVQVLPQQIEWVRCPDVHPWYKKPVWASKAISLLMIHQWWKSPYWTVKRTDKDLLNNNQKAFNIYVKIFRYRFQSLGSSHVNIMILFKICSKN